MVNEEKVHIMTQIALEEKGKKKKDINEGGYYKKDYIWAHCFSAIWNITVSYLLVIFLVALYHADYIFVNVVRLNYKKIMLLVFGIYVLFVLVVTLFSYYYFAEKYVRERKGIWEYYKKLEKLDDFYKQSEEETENDTFTAS